MKDKNGNNLHNGDVVYVEWNVPNNQPRVGFIRRTLKHRNIQHNLAHIYFKEYESWDVYFFRSEKVEKLPEDEQKRNEILMLRKLEQ